MLEQNASMASSSKMTRWKVLQPQLDTGNHHKANDRDLNLLEVFLNSTRRFSEPACNDQPPLAPRPILKRDFTSSNPTFATILDKTVRKLEIDVEEKTPQRDALGPTPLFTEEEFASIGSLEPWSELCAGVLFELKNSQALVDMFAPMAQPAQPKVPTPAVKFASAPFKTNLSPKARPVNTSQDVSTLTNSVTPIERLANPGPESPPLSNEDCTLNTESIQTAKEESNNGMVSSANSVANVITGLSSEEKVEGTSGVEEFKEPVTDPSEIRSAENDGEENTQEISNEEAFSSVVNGSNLHKVVNLKRNPGEMAVAGGEFDDSKELKQPERVIAMMDVRELRKIFPPVNPAQLNMRRQSQTFGRVEIPASVGGLPYRFQQFGQSSLSHDQLKKNGAADLPGVEGMKSLDKVNCKRYGTSRLKLAPDARISSFAFADMNSRALSKNTKSASKPTDSLWLSFPVNMEAIEKKLSYLEAAEAAEEGCLTNKIQFDNENGAEIPVKSDSNQKAEGSMALDASFFQPQGGDDKISTKSVVAFHKVDLHTDSGDGKIFESVPDLLRLANSLRYTYPPLIGVSDIRQRRRPQPLHQSASMPQISSFRNLTQQATSLQAPVLSGDSLRTTSFISISTTSPFSSSARPSTRAKTAAIKKAAKIDGDDESGETQQLRNTKFVEARRRHVSAGERRTGDGTSLDWVQNKKKSQQDKSAPEIDQSNGASPSATEEVPLDEFLNGVGKYSARASRKNRPVTTGASRRSGKKRLEKQLILPSINVPSDVCTLKDSVNLVEMNASAFNLPTSGIVGDIPKEGKGYESHAISDPISQSEVTTAASEAKKRRGRHAFKRGHAGTQKTSSKAAEARIQGDGVKAERLSLHGHKLFEKMSVPVDHQRLQLALAKLV
ncbi:hypothetical protein HDU67_010308 [Dinochytrium kinnereticum]|nr:hypothetical protein HDU67_010308 [Dinochytrium kinnereticum]